MTETAGLAAELRGELCARHSRLRPTDNKNYLAGWGAGCGAVPKFTFGASRDPSAALK